MGLSTLPPVKDVRDLLESLLGRDVDVKDGPVWIPPAGEKILVAEFVDDDGALATLGIVDSAAGAYIGAAMGLLPPGGAQDMAKDGDLSPVVRENLYETMNIACSLFNLPGQPHVKIAALYDVGTALPPTVDAAVKRPTGRMDLAIKVSGYGEGRFSLVVAN
ncbi:MAG TPA: hypothetical protein VHD87_13850 [Acidimicrobiales bacterium]|nr:hypothetical protein [Acidimicrobiales bacterium]